METTSAPVLSRRKKELATQYIAELDIHIKELKEGKVERAFEIRDLAQILHVHPAAVARQLTYDPSNFTKFFKHFTGITPKKFRDHYFSL